ncbi:MAG: hypothetical protein M4D80_31670 [Myxococcota bacterium]|nr:hypothetical protein [Myxococcota bacterium]
MREEQDELVTLEGRVIGDAEARSPVVTAALVVGDSELPFDHRAAFEIELASGRRVTIEPAKTSVIRPERKVTGPWRELAKHPVRPTGDFHPDGHVKLSGEWIVPGERIAVIGYVTGHDFVPETGTHREAPERQVSLVRAIAIGVGDDAADDVKKAIKDREKTIANARKPKAPPSSTKWAWLSIFAVVAAVLFVIIDRRTHAQTLGLALATSIFALLFFWRASPTQHFPGGAVDEGEVTDPGTMVGLMTVLLAPIVILLFFLAGTDEPGKRNGMTNAGWLMLGLFPLFRIVMAVIAKPRAENGAQVLLPASPLRRWILILGLLATWIASLALAVPHMSGDGIT